jgi:hypothetical protein
MAAIVEAGFLRGRRFLPMMMTGVDGKRLVGLFVFYGRKKKMVGGTIQSWMCRIEPYALSKIHAICHFSTQRIFFCSSHEATAVAVVLVGLFLFFVAQESERRREKSTRKE